jgi:diphthamide biosynthesis enzyme Dph1/Dph2-like protein
MSFFLEELADCILQTESKSVALQLPDHYLEKGPSICRTLQKSLGPSVQVYILGDT